MAQLNEAKVRESIADYTASRLIVLSDRLEGLVVSLGTRLSIISSSPCPQPSRDIDDSEEPSLSPLFNTMRTTMNSIEATCDRFQDIYDRLEV